MRSTRSASNPRLAKNFTEREVLAKRGMGGSAYSGNRKPPVLDMNRLRLTSSGVRTVVSGIGKAALLFVG